MCENYCRMQLLYQLRQRKLMENNQQINIYYRIKKRVQNSKIQEQELSFSESIEKESIFPFIIRKSPQEHKDQIQSINTGNNRSVPQNKVKLNAKPINNNRSISVSRRISPFYDKNLIYDQINTKLDKEKKTIVVFSQRENPLKNDYIYRFCKRDSQSSQSRRSNYNAYF
ncbi:unnamed protein product [Paramecium primaurelia]|uniref:Uncharacterized protein n=1 Tax=Paramecium primaurelia TaxID=5886 RepID=A0A8S1K5A6_PARPR|nr:unnamed protein product [Paramecium primaurelia]